MMIVMMVVQKPPMSARGGGAKELNMKGFLIELNVSCLLSIHSVQVEAMQLFFLWMIFMFPVECRGEDSVKQPPTPDTATEGHSVALNCTYQISDMSSYTLFWYKQDGNNRPTLILRHNKHSKAGKTEKEFEERFSSELDENSRSVPLMIQKLQPSDSAVYYCALMTGSNQNRLLFGAGTILTITTSEVYEPSYYLLDENDKKVCLATGFSQHDQHKNSTLFSSTTPARISGDSLFSQVAFNASDHNCMAAGGDGGSVSCEDKMKPDPTVNLVSVTVLGLRLIFLKTIVFNVFLTFRLWHSR